MDCTLLSGTMHAQHEARIFGYLQGTPAGRAKMAHNTHTSHDSARTARPADGDAPAALAREPSLGGAAPAVKPPQARGGPTRFGFVAKSVLLGPEPE